jgi:hypothetical protein
MFTGFNKEVLAMVAVLLSEYKTLHDFLKLAIVTVDRLGTKRHDKSKTDFLKEVETYVDVYFDKKIPISS